MKSPETPFPALCHLPLIEAPRSAGQNNVGKLEWRATGFLLRIIARVCQAFAFRAPVGYEDETGFHYGVAEASLPVIRTGGNLRPPPGQAGLQARWKATRPPRLISGRQLVLQWDSSSLPPSRLSPDSLSLETGRRSMAETVTDQCPASFTCTGSTGRLRVAGPRITLPPGSKVEP